MTLDELEQRLLNRVDDTALGIFIIDAVEQYRRSQHDGNEPLVSGSLPPTVDEIAEAANSYLGLNSGMTYEDMVAAGHFVAGVTWAIEKMTGGNDR